MARITRVAKAQQRYKMVPVLDENGQPKRTPVINKKTGEQKTSKRGAQFMTVTVADKNQPLPMPRCDFPGCEDREIKVGTPYMHISPKSGPYGGRTLYRHGNHPVWNVWDYSSSLSARIAQIQSEEVDLSGLENEDDVRSAVEDIVQQIRDLAEEKRESASNIEEGFGHETESSMALNEVADGLDEWADNLENFEVPEVPEPAERFYVTKDGDRFVDEGIEADGYEEETEAHADLESYLNDANVPEDEWDNYDVESEEGDEPTEGQWDEWRSEVESAIADALGDVSVG